ncbi:MAG: type II toxin-antitoxin system RelE/ParE family toxin [Patescibacteria group bacterium]
MYQLLFTSSFNKDYKKVAGKNTLLQKRILKSLSLLSNNPNHPSLRTHKVNSLEFDNVWSSWVTGDVRIIWEYNNNLRIKLLALSTHSGSNKVYK